MSNLAIGDDGSGTKTNMLIPGILTLSCFGLLGYHYSTQETYDYAMCHFLAIVCLQMFPLLALKMKIYQCGDRLSLVPRVLVKTILMHIVLAILRIIPPFMRRNWTIYDMQLGVDVCGLLAAIGVLSSVFGYHLTPRTFIEEREVRNLCVMAIIAAFSTEVVVGIFPKTFSFAEATGMMQERGFIKKTVFTAANYVDVIAFMPVVLKLYEIERDDDIHAGTSVPMEARRQVLMFFTFVVGFYSWDDVIDPIRNYEGTYDVVAMMAHAAHFVLLLDFAAFFIMQVWTPSSNKGEQLQGLLEQGFDQDD